MQKESQKILNRFIKDCGGISNALEKIKSEVVGELEEFTFIGANGYAAYGNGEFIVYVDDQEDADVYVVDSYGDKDILVST